MRVHTFAFLAVLLAGALAFAGTRARESAGAVPTLATDGVSIVGATACRMSARVTDGGAVNGGTLVPYYYDAVLGWVRAGSATDCTLESNKLLDGGAPSAQVCLVDVAGASWGRIAAVANGLFTADGGPATANIRVECFDPTIP